MNITYPIKKSNIVTSLLLMLFCLLSHPVIAGSATDYDAVPPVISLLGIADKPNIMVILDNSNSMDEATDGHAVGSASADSKSEISRNAIKGIIDTFGNSMRMGLMAYDQDSISKRQLHDSQYDASFDPANYDPNYTGIRDSLTKAKRVPNPTDSGNFIHYNIALPFYSGSSQGNAFCYSSKADFDNGSETVLGPWDNYECYSKKIGTSDSTTTGMSNYLFNSNFRPTDSDIAQNLLDFGTFLTWQHVGDTWFANSSPGGGKVHVDIKDVDATQKNALKAKLATSQFSTATDTPLRNAGLTPIEGTLEDAGSYFNTYSSGNFCSVSEKDYVVLVTDGLPSVDKNGNKTTDTAAAVAAAATAAAKLLVDGIRTYVIGFALPSGVDPTLLDKIAIAGGTVNAYPADDSVKLNAALSSIFLNIINRSSSGTGAAVLANNSRGDGAFYQALYVPSKQDTKGREVTWVGVLNGLFIDQYGLLREDSNGNNQIDGYTTDKVVEYFYDTANSRTRVYLKTGADQNTLSTSATVEIEDLKYIWSARDQLASISDPITQRTYTNSAATGRTIYTTGTGSDLTDFSALTSAEITTLNNAQTTAKTALDNAITAAGVTETARNTAYNNWTAGGSVTGGALETAYLAAEAAWANDKAAVAIAQSAYDDALNKVLGAKFLTFMDLSATEADKTIRWIRGEEVTGYRSRELDWNGNGSSQIWRLGDIIHSTPVVVATPKDRYDLTYNDETYAAFVDKYYNRRHVIYVGANDGMLHAFNAGFWDDTNKKFHTDNAFSTQNGSSTVTAHPLGSELWAYVPKATLPHLQWLTSPNYSHTYYVDGEPLTFDANIFAADSDHPNGWGTILVVPMRLGGGLYSFDTDGDGTDEDFSSSISIFDVTNPEKPPILLAEITHPDLGFTTSKPALVKARLEAATGGYSTPSADRWLLAFGSGPTILDSATSNQEAGLFLYDLESLSFVNNYSPLKLGGSNNYVGSIGVADWEDDYVDDALYFGLNSGVKATESGKIKRIRLGSTDTSTFDENAWLTYGTNKIGTLFNSNLTTLGAPMPVRDDNGRHWIYAGTGRLLTASASDTSIDDNSSNIQQYFYGIMEPINSSTGEETLATVTKSQLEDSTDIRVFTNGEVDRNGSTFQIPSGTNIENFNQLEYGISNSKLGWYHKLERNGSAKASGRNINGAARFRSMIFYTEYTPSDDQCEPEGNSELHAIYYKTGTATPYDVIGTDPNTVKNAGELVLSGADLGKGLASAPTVIANNSGSNSNSAGTLAIQLGTGELKLINFGEGGSRGGRESWKEVEMDGLNL